MSTTLMLVLDRLGRRRVQGDGAWREVWRVRRGVGGSHISLYPKDGAWVEMLGLAPAVARWELAAANEQPPWWQQLSAGNQTPMRAHLAPTPYLYALDGLAQPQTGAAAKNRELWLARQATRRSCRGGPHDDPKIKPLFLSLVGRWRRKGTRGSLLGSGC